MLNNYTHDFLPMASGALDWVYEWEETSCTTRVSQLLLGTHFIIKGNLWSYKCARFSTVGAHSYE